MKTNVNYVMVEVSYISEKMRVNNRIAFISDNSVFAVTTEDVAANYPTLKWEPTCKEAILEYADVYPEEVYKIV